MSDSLWPHPCDPRLLCPWNSADKSTGVGCHFLPQGIFLTQRSNPQLLLGRQVLYHWASREAHKTCYTVLNYFSFPLNCELLLEGRDLPLVLFYPHILIHAFTCGAAGGGSVTLTSASLRRRGLQASLSSIYWSLLKLVSIKSSPIIMSKKFVE